MGTMITTAGRAGLTLRQQVEMFGGGQVSLDSLWRAVARPEGHDPRAWSIVAAPLLTGYAAYLSNLKGSSAPAVDAARLLWTWQDESKDPWLTGDLMGEEFIARTYAEYLDHHIGR
jgi:hypothetical protein